MGEAGSTVWEGSALNCESTGDEIILLHTRFSAEGPLAYGTCNDGAVEGQSVKVEDGAYMSRLVVNVRSEMIGRSIECVYDDGSTTNLIDMATITPTTGTHMSLIACRFLHMNKVKLKFSVTELLCTYKSNT